MKWLCTEAVYVLAVFDLVREAVAELNFFNQLFLYLGVKSDEELSQHSNKSNTGPDNEDASSVSKCLSFCRQQIYYLL